jgi:hypothetical protein
MVRTLVLTLFCVLLALLSSSKADAADSTTVGVYVNQVASIDLKTNSFTIDFWIWFRSKGRTVSPVDSFELVDGRVNSKTNVIKKTLPNGEDYAAVRVNATVHQQWDLRRYPFDNHELSVMIEETDLDVKKSVFVSDTQGQGKDPNVVVSGWDIVGFSTAVDAHRYESNYGDTTISSNAAESSFSRFTFRLPAKRMGLARYLKLTFPLFISVLVAWCGFFIRAKDTAPRVAVAVGALFAAAAATVAINSQLPDINYATVADRTVFLCFAAIGVSLLSAVVSLTMHYRGDDRGPRVDRMAAVGFPIVFVAILLWIAS